MLARPAHRAELDGLRGVAILLVVGYHLVLGERPLLAGGFVGVDLFFVVSGALITRLLLREHEATGTIDFTAFYLRRATRILPALAVMLAVTVAYTTFTWSAENARFVRTNAAMALLFLSSWVSTKRSMWLLTPTWSLSIEEWFYLVWPVALLALVRHRARTGLRPVALALALVVVACLARRFELYEIELVPLRRIYFALDTRADALACGGLVAVLEETGRLRSTKLVALGAAMGAAVLAASALFVDASTAAFAILGYFATAVSSAFVVLRAMRASSSVLGWRPLTAIGRISYSLYLWQLPIFTFLAERPVAVRLLALFAVSSASYRWVERPGIALRRRFVRLSE